MTLKMDANVAQVAAVERRTIEWHVGWYKRQGLNLEMVRRVLQKEGKISFNFLENFIQFFRKFYLIF